MAGMYAGPTVLELGRGIEVDVFDANVSGREVFLSFSSVYISSIIPHR